MKELDYHGWNNPLSGKWTHGPRLPVTSQDATLLTDADGGVVLIGGASNENEFEKRLWYLSDAQSRWELLPRALRFGRHGHTAFFVPDDVVSAC